MLELLNPLSMLLHNPKAVNLTVFFASIRNIKTSDHDIFNKYALYKFNQYKGTNAKNVTFENLKANYFNKFHDST